MTLITRTRLTTLALIVAAAPLLSACGGGANAAHDSCMTEAANQAGEVSGEGAGAYEGDYDLMPLCDQLVGEYDDEGRVSHILGCIGDRVASGIEPEGIFSQAYAEGSSVPSLMNDPFSVGACV